MKAHRFKGWIGHHFPIIRPRKVIGYALLTGLAGTGSAYIGGVAGQFAGNYQDYAQHGHLFSVDGAQIKMPDFRFWPSVQYALHMPYGHIGLIVVAGGIACLTGYVVFRNIAESRDTDGRGFLQSDKGTYGTSGWMDDKAFRMVLDAMPPSLNRGVPLGLRGGLVVSLPDGPKHKLNRNIAVYGTPGCGKTRGFVVNQILYAVTRGESVILTDTKGELYEMTSDYLRRCGYNVKMFNLVEFDHSDGWNCLNEIRGDQTRAQLFVDTIIKNTTNGKPDPFWTNAEMNLLKALVLYVYMDEGRDESRKTLGDVYEMICNCSGSALDALFSALPPEHPARMPYALYAMNAGNEKVSGGVRLGLGARLQVLQSSAVRELLAHDDMRLDAPAHEKCAYFIRISDQNATFQFLSSLMFSFLFMDIIDYADTHGRKCPVPVNFVLDEFPNIGEIPDFTKKLSTVRSRHVNVDVIFQGIPQLKNRYPLDQWREILDDCDTSIFLGGNGDMTTEYVSKQTGEISVKVDTEARNLNLFRMTDATRQFKRSEGLGRRQLMTSDEVRRLENNEEIVILRGQKPLMLDKFDFTKNPDSRKLREVRVTDYDPGWEKRQPVRDFKVKPDKPPAPAGAASASTPAAPTPLKEVKQNVKPKTHRGRKKSGPPAGQQTLINFPSAPKADEAAKEQPDDIKGYQSKDPSEL